MASHDLKQTRKLPFRDSQVPAPVAVAVSHSHDTYLETPTTKDSGTIGRRSANYKQSIWDDDFVQSLSSAYTDEIYAKKAEELKEGVRSIFDEVTSSGSSLSLLKLIDTIQRLGVSYHFIDEIKGALDTIVYNEEKDLFQVADEDLFTTALRFRLLRQHGYEVSVDIFKSFKEEKGSSSGDWKPSTLKDVKGMLSLYEASFHAYENEEKLDEAQIFTSRLLKEYLLNNEGLNNNDKQLISHALETPLRWRVPRIEARWFIDAYENMQDHFDRPLLLEFAKLDFNIVQATYQEELKYASRWWKDLGLTNELSYARDRLVENFFWSVGFNFDPKLGDFRIKSTKLNGLMAVVDDTYDIYGSLEELELFTGVVERWDNTMEGLPDYMRACFLALYNTTNEIAYDILEKHGRDVLPYLKNAWADLCNAYLKEAKWYYSGYTPTFEEHINFTWISGTGCIQPTFLYCLLGNEIKEEPLECLKNYSSNLIRWAFMIVRFEDDLAATDELERGDITTSIQCYMSQEGVSESIACEHVKHLIRDRWKKINKEQYAHNSIFPRSFVDTMLDLVRITHFYYQDGVDGYGVHPDRLTKDWITSVIIEPIPIEDKSETN